MAKYIVDTHTLVWFLSDGKRLGTEAKKALKDPKSEFYILTNVFEEVRRKFEKFKKDNNNKSAIKIPPIICWLIAKKSKNVKICRLDQSQISMVDKKSEIGNINKDDIPFVVKYCILREKYPRTEIKIITCEDKIRKSNLTRTCW